VIEIGKDNQQIAHYNLPDIPVEKFAYIDTGLEWVSIHEMGIIFMCFYPGVYQKSPMRQPASMSLPG
jgi:hypothetical protein